MQSVKVDENSGWNYTFQSVPENENGKPVSYSVSMEKVKGYEISVKRYEITAKHTLKSGSGYSKSSKPSEAKQEAFQESHKAEKKLNAVSFAIGVAAVAGAFGYAIKRKKKS